MLDIFYNYGAEDPFRYLVDELQNPRPLLEAFRSYRVSQFRQAISLGQDPYGQPVERLSDRYRIWKEKKVGKKAIRSLTGKMLRSYRCEVSGDRLIESISDPKAQWIQEGTAKMPARPMLPTDDRGISAKDQTALLDIAVTRINREARVSIGY